MFEFLFLHLLCMTDVRLLFFFLPIPQNLPKATDASKRIIAYYLFYQTRATRFLATFGYHSERECHFTPWMLLSQYEFAIQIKRLQQSLCHTDIVSVPTGEQKAQWIPKPIRYRMDFRGQAPSAPSGFLVISPFLPPLACWWTLIVVLSSINVVSSTKSCSIRAVRISSHTPAFVQERNRLYTLCHGPNRSVRSFHGIPVFS